MGTPSSSCRDEVHQVCILLALRRNGEPERSRRRLSVQRFKDNFCSKPQQAAWKARGHASSKVKSRPQAAHCKVTESCRETPWTRTRANRGPRPRPWRSWPQDFDSGFRGQRDGQSPQGDAEETSLPGSALARPLCHRKGPFCAASLFAGISAGPVSARAVIDT